MRLRVGRLFGWPVHINRPPALPALDDILTTAGQVVTLDGQVAQFTPTQPGTYYVTVNATDDLGEEDGTYLKLVVAKASAPVFQGNTIQDCKPGTPGLHVLNEDLVVADTVIAGCSPGLKAEFNLLSAVAPKRVVFADSQNYLTRPRRRAVTSTRSLCRKRSSRRPAARRAPSG